MQSMLTLIICKMLLGALRNPISGKEGGASALINAGVGRNVLPGGAAVAGEPRAHRVSRLLQVLARVPDRHNHGRRIIMRVEGWPPVWAQARMGTSPSKGG